MFGNKKDQRMVFLELRKNVVDNENDLFLKGFDFRI